MERMIFSETNLECPKCGSVCLRVTCDAEFSIEDGEIKEVNDSVGGNDSVDCEECNFSSRIVVFRKKHYTEEQLHGMIEHRVKTLSQDAMKKVTQILFGIPVFEIENENGSSTYTFHGPQEDKSKSKK